ncbi:MAG: CDP-6-deoxy-delta-3,4-glucoseen reductase [Thiotrichaceae bacterium]
MSYQVTIQPSGHTIEVEKQEPILDAALRKGVSFPYGCRSGVCGTCLGKVLEGKVSYPDGLPMGLSDDDHEKGSALFCQAVPESDLLIEVAEIEAIGEIEVKTLPVKIASLRKLSPDVMEVLLKLPETERMQFLAGQYIDILLSMGKRRAFSLANAPFNDEYLELHIRHVEGGTFTGQVFNELKEKSLLRIEGPHGSFFLRETDRPKVLMGGGTGFAPLKGMIEQLIQENNQASVYLYWGVRSKTDLYHQGLAEKWAFQHENIHFIPVLSEPGEDENWQGVTGFVHNAVINDFTDMSGFDVYMSGPPVMVEAGVTAFKAAGLSDDHMYSDSFEYGEDTLVAMNDQ